PSKKSANTMKTKRWIISSNTISNYGLGYKTLKGRGCFELCPVCFWEDSGVDEPNPDDSLEEERAGFSLLRARRNFDLYGACEEKWIKSVRPPKCLF
ncbi:MAG: CPCC family cysteine-rich protein, partial [Terriglobia bacterium]